MNILISYFYLNPVFNSFIEHTGQRCSRIMMDSGAFSAYHVGAKIVLGEYIATLRRLEGSLFASIMLDVLRDREATRKNLDTMVQKRTKPMPVWTADGTEEDLEWMAERANGKVCVATDGSSVSWVGPRLQRARDVVGPDVFLHALAFTINTAAATEANSVDSSSVTSARRYGFVTSFVPGYGVKKILWSKLRDKRFEEMPPWVRDLAVETGLPTSFFREKQTGLASKLNYLGISAAIDYARWLKTQGVRSFFAISGAQDAAQLATVSMHKEGRRLDWEAIAQDDKPVMRIMKEKPDVFADYFQQASNKQGLFW